MGVASKRIWGKLLCYGNQMHTVCGLSLVAYSNYLFAVLLKNNCSVVRMCELAYIKAMQSCHHPHHLSQLHKHTQVFFFFVFFFDCSFFFLTTTATSKPLPSCHTFVSKTSINWIGFSKWPPYSNTFLWHKWHRKFGLKAMHAYVCIMYSLRYIARFVYYVRKFSVL